MLPLDSSILMTQGNPVSIGALLALFHPERGVFTGICSIASSETFCIAQVHHTGGERIARLSFVLPSTGAESSATVGLFEALAAQSGDWGAFNLLAEVDELAPAFLGLRRAGFSVYGWQRIWQLPFMGESNTTPGGGWQIAEPSDEIAVRSLAQTLVPPLVQGADPLPGRRLQGLVYYQGGEIMAYIESVFGPVGIFLLPLIHPSVEDVAPLIKGLEKHLFPLLMRPVFLAVRSYQAWLETALEDLEWKAAPRQALMVKHLTKTQTLAMPVRQAVMEHSPAPLAQNYTCPKN
jgi:hypothetical protein